MYLFCNGMIYKLKDSKYKDNHFNNKLTNFNPYCLKSKTNFLVI